MNRAYTLGSPNNWWLEDTHIFKYLGRHTWDKLDNIHKATTLGVGITFLYMVGFADWLKGWVEQAAWTSSVLILRQEFRHVGADWIWLVTQKSWWNLPWVQNPWIETDIHILSFLGYYLGLEKEYIHAYFLRSSYFQITIFLGGCICILYLRRIQYYCFNRNTSYWSVSTCSFMK